MPNFLDGFDRLVAFDAETTGKRTPDAEYIRKQPFAWKAPGIIIEVGFVELLREDEGWRKGEAWSSKTPRPSRSTGFGQPISRTLHGSQ
jgi:DNA polymerase-3 subunit epsilon